jgi:hypothetical protein
MPYERPFPKSDGRFYGAANRHLVSLNDYDKWPDSQNEQTRIIGIIALAILFPMRYIIEKYGNFNKLRGFRNEDFAQ